MSDAWFGELAQEMAEADLGDPRLTRRLGRMVEQIARQPDLSFPKLFDSAGLEAAYRFFGNPAVGPEGILSGHYAATARRSHAASRVLVVHDSTTLSFRTDGQRKGLGRLRTSGQSFFAHVSLVLAGDGSRRPLGVVGLTTWNRGEQRPERSERARWPEQCELVATRLSETSNVVHVMDREADDFALFVRLMGRHRFIVRAQHDRLLSSNEQKGARKLNEATMRIERAIEREAALSKRVDGNRAPVQKKIHPSRAARIAKLSIGAMRATLKCPRSQDTRDVLTIDLNVVHVWEPNPPEGEAPIEWTLLTSEPIDTPEQVAWIVDSYRARWTIEEYFKALKTGCAYEARQLEDYEGLINALAVFAPIACRLLELRSEARRAPGALASDVLTPTQIEVLRALGRMRLPSSPTLRDVLFAIAALGGHQKHSGEPGWLTLSRGYAELLTLTRGWEAAKLQHICDQG
jgi:hypothetical protein